MVFGTWANDGVGQRIAIDICTPPVHIDGEWLFDDLELDLYRRGSRLGVFDEDEFDDGYAAGRIGPDEAQACRVTASELHHRLRDGDALFDSVGWDQLQRAIGLSLAPLATDLNEA
jgi:predicted RNA-binding protein associated with RNAse of E/G family